MAAPNDKNTPPPLARFPIGTIPGEDILHGTTIIPLQVPDTTVADKVIPLPGNSMIWATSKDGPGPVGNYNDFVNPASAITLIAGFGGNDPDPTMTARPNGGSATLPKILGDSAYITVTERTSDEFRGIPEGDSGMSKDKSAVILKADDIRAVSRRGIKLVTGPGGPEGLDSTQKVMNEVFGVEIIAGGKDHTEKGEPYLQPMVKGIKLQKALRKLNDNVKRLNSQVTQMNKLMIQLAGALSKVQYYGANAGGPVVSTAPELALIGTFINATLTNVITPELAALAKELTFYDLNYIEKSGNDSFLSKLNKVN